MLPFQRKWLVGTSFMEGSRIGVSCANRGETSFNQRLLHIHGPDAGALMRRCHSAIPFTRLDVCPSTPFTFSQSVAIRYCRFCWVVHWPFGSRTSYIASADYSPLLHRQQYLPPSASKGRIFVEVFVPCVLFLSVSPMLCAWRKQSTSAVQVML